jgi:hypothetical protein
MSNSSRVTLQCDRKRLMPGGIEHMLVHLTGPRDLLTSLDVDRVPARSKSADVLSTNRCVVRYGGR